MFKKSLGLKGNLQNTSLIIILCLLSRSAIQWAKMDQLIPSGGKKKNRKRNIAGGINAFVTRKGSLRIPGIGYQDAGIYSCMGMTILLIFKKFVQLLITKMTLPSDLFSQTFSMRKWCNDNYKLLIQIPCHENIKNVVKQLLSKGLYHAWLFWFT